MLLDVVTAIEGPGEAFRCTEIRRRGAGAGVPPREYLRPCGIAAAMHRAEAVWRRELASQTIADMSAAAPTPAADRLRYWHAAKAP